MITVLNPKKNEGAPFEAPKWIKYKGSPLTQFILTQFPLVKFFATYVTHKWGNCRVSVQDTNSRELALLK